MLQLNSFCDAVCSYFPTSFFLLSLQSKGFQTEEQSTHIRELVIFSQ